MPASLHKRDVLHVHAVELAPAFDNGPAGMATPEGHTVQELQNLLTAAYLSPAEPSWPFAYSVGIALGVGLLAWSAAIFGLSKLF
jgi:hypothetical protein